MKALENLLNEYDIAIEFAVNKTERLKSIHAELEVKDQFVRNYRKIVEQNAKKENNLVAIELTLEALKEAVKLVEKQIELAKIELPKN